MDYLYVFMWVFLFFLIRQVVEVIGSLLFAMQVTKISYTGLIPITYWRGKIGDTVLNFGGLLIPNVQVSMESWVKEGMLGKRGLVVIFRMVATVGTTILLLSLLTDASAWQTLFHRDLYKTFSEYAFSFDKDTMPLYLRLGVSLLTTHMLLLPVGIFIDLIDLFGVVLLLIAEVLGKGIPEKKQDGEDVIEIRISVWLVVGIVVLLAGSMIYLILRAEF